MPKGPAAARAEPDPSCKVKTFAVSDRVSFRAVNNLLIQDEKLTNRPVPMPEASEIM
jgi:hypothetical protein